MTYTKHTWNAGKAGGTPITAVKLNQMEDGIAAAATTTGVAADVANPESTIGSALSAAIVASTVGKADASSVLSVAQMDRSGSAALAAYGAAASKRLADATDLDGKITSMSATVGSDNWRIQLPDPYDASIPAPLVLLLHNSSGTAQNLFDDSRSAAFLSALSDAGYIIASADAGGSAWGNDSSRAKYEALYEYVRVQYSVSCVVLVGASMGGQVAWNLLPRTEIPNIVAALLIAGVCNLDSLYDGNYATQIKAAFGVASDGSDYEDKTAGFHPEDRAGWEMRGVPVMLVSSPDDPTCFTSDAQAMVTKLTPYVPEATLVMSTGAHMAKQQFDSAATYGIPFLSKYAPVAKVTVAPPSPLEGASQFWDASTLTASSALASWTDSVNGDTVTQATSAAQPSVVTDSDGTYVHFDGSDDYLSDETLPRVATETEVMLVRLHKSPTLTHRYLASSTDASGYRTCGFGSDLSGFVMNDGATLATSPAVAPDTDWHVVILVHNGASSVIGIDGAETSGNAGTAQARTGLRMATSNGNPTTNGTPVDLMRYYLIPRLLDADERTAVYTELAAVIA